MPNIEHIIQAHNAKILNSGGAEPKPCSCRNKKNCPLDGSCQEECLVYKAEVQSKKETKICYGMCEGKFKIRYNNHQKSFRGQKYENETALSKFVW